MWTGKTSRTHSAQSRWCLCRWYLHFWPWVVVVCVIPSPRSALFVCPSLCDVLIPSNALACHMQKTQRTKSRCPQTSSHLYSPNQTKDPTGVIWWDREWEISWVPKSLLHFKEWLITKTKSRAKRGPWNIFKIASCEEEERGGACVWVISASSDEWVPEWIYAAAAAAAAARVRPRMDSSLSA